MSEIMSAMSTQQYRPSRRSWVKLWVNEWLTGTVRWQLTPQQRSMWADLLALAGNSRFPGIICSGETNGILDPFPMDYLCSVFRCSEPDVRAAFDLFVAQSRIVINEAGVIQIVNWDKYQSEYQLKRQRRTYNEPPRSDGEANVRRKSRKTPPEEGEVEVDGEKEVETLFAVFWNLYPRKVGKEKAIKWWSSASKMQKVYALKGLRCWVRAEQWNRDDGKFIPYASTFLAQKRYLDEPWTGAFEEEKWQNQK